MLELMVVVLIVGILAAIALPSFSVTIQSNRVAATTNELVASLSLARSEAIRSNLGNGNQRATSVCSSADRVTCGGVWNNGWIVFRDDDLDGSPGAGEILRFVEPAVGIDVASANAQFDFDNRGRRLPPADLTPPVGFVLRPVACVSGRPFQRTLTITATGQARFVRQNCP